MGGGRAADGRAVGWRSNLRRLAGWVISPAAVTLLWLALVLAGPLWAPLAPVAERLAFAAEVILATLALHVVHEAGHVLAGLAVGLPFTRATVACLTVAREEGPDGARLRWSVNDSWLRFGGCVEREVSPAPRMRQALTITALGGPWASVVGGLALLGSPDPWHGIGMISVLVGLLNAVPMSVFGQASDGMIVLRLWSRDPGHVAWRHLLCGTEAGERGPARAGAHPAPVATGEG
jgi:hypothetical protein